MAVVWNMCGFRISQRRHAWIVIPILGLLIFALVLSLGVPADEEVGSPNFAERTKNSVGQPITRKKYGNGKHNQKKNSQSTIDVDTTVEKYAGERGGTMVEGYTTYRLRLKLPDECVSIAAHSRYQCLPDVKLFLCQGTQRLRDVWRSKEPSARPGGLVFTSGRATHQTAIKKTIWTARCARGSAQDIGAPSISLQMT